MATRSKANTKAINLRIEVEHEQLLRDVVSRIRSGGSGFRAALSALIDDEGATEYVPAREVHARFAELERKMHAESESHPAGGIHERFDALAAELDAAKKHANEVFLPAGMINERFSEMEQRMTQLEKRVSEWPWIP